MPDLGGKRMEFEQDSGGKVAMSFRVANVTKPLASVSGITKKNNKVVFGPTLSYIENLTTGKRAPLTEENGVYTLTVPIERIKKGSNSTHEGFARQGA